MQEYLLLCQAAEIASSVSWVELTIVSTSSTGVVPSDITLELEFISERYEYLDPTIVPVLHYNSTNSLISWAPIAGALRNL